MISLLHTLPEPNRRVPVTISLGCTYRQVKAAGGSTEPCVSPPPPSGNGPQAASSSFLWWPIVVAVGGAALLACVAFFAVTGRWRRKEDMAPPMASDQAAVDTGKGSVPPHQPTVLLKSSSGATQGFPSRETSLRPMADSSGQVPRGSWTGITGVQLVDTETEPSRPDVCGQLRGTVAAVAHPAASTSAGVGMVGCSDNIRHTASLVSPTAPNPRGSLIIRGGNSDGSAGITTLDSTRGLENQGVAAIPGSAATRADNEPLEPDILGLEEASTAVGDGEGIRPSTTRSGLGGQINNLFQRPVDVIPAKPPRIPTGGLLAAAPSRSASGRHSSLGGAVGNNAVTATAVSAGNVPPRSRGPSPPSRRPSASEGGRFLLSSSELAAGSRRPTVPKLFRRTSGSSCDGGSAEDIEETEVLPGPALVVSRPSGPNGRALQPAPRASSATG